MFMILFRILLLVFLIAAFAYILARVLKCDKCWGSGDKNRIWEDLKSVRAVRSKLDKMEDALSEERLIRLLQLGILPEVIRRDDTSRIFKEGMNVKKLAQAIRRELGFGEERGKDELPEMS